MYVRLLFKNIPAPDLVFLHAFLQWKKYWFVLTDHSLRYYKDSIAEEVKNCSLLLLLSTSLCMIVEFFFNFLSGLCVFTGV